MCSRPSNLSVNHHASEPHASSPSSARVRREKGERFIAGFIARRVLAAVRIGLWRLLNFDVTKSPYNGLLVPLPLGRGVHA